MAITYPLTWPTALGFATFRFIYRNAVGRNESPFNFAEQVYDWGGQIWEIEGTMPVMERATAEIFNAFLAALKGRKGTFLVPFPGQGTPLGLATGTPLVKGGSQTGSSLITDGWTVSQSPIIKAGSLFSLGTGTSTRLYKILQDANSNGSGDATLDIWPDLRSSPADNAALDLTDPYGLFRMASNVQPIDINNDSQQTFSFRAIEALS